MIVEYTIKKTGKTADEIREKIRSELAVDCFVELHPNRLKVHLSSEIPREGVRILDKIIEENLDGRRIEVVP
ncbi:MAG: hypothetical protein DRJ03_21270 [Chloroflexi bacterium]|nr:MAG: hypothetical protein DRJ03_21270 [Chloroflexota bacterium]